MILLHHCTERYTYSFSDVPWVDVLPSTRCHCFVCHLIYILVDEKNASCEIEDFVETHLRKLRRMLRSRSRYYSYGFYVSYTEYSGVYDTIRVSVYQVYDVS